MKSRRSQGWYGGAGKTGAMHRGWMKNQGRPHDLFDGRPVIGICNTWSEFNPCHGHFRELADCVKRGVWEAGGFPLEFPVMSLSESQLRPTAMLFRNLVSMEVEESIRGQPIDGVVLLMGCDKTTPALLMGAASCDLPTIGLSGGPMLNGKFRGKDVGSGTFVWQLCEQVRSGEAPANDLAEAEQSLNRSTGHCMTMGTASTMACMVEALGVSLPGNAAIPAVDARRQQLAQLTGRRIVDMVKIDLRLSQLITAESLNNAIRTNVAIGGSTNAVIHLLAIARRIGIDLKLADFDRLGAKVPCLVDLQPAGRFLMEDFYYAGGLPVVLKQLGEADLLQRAAITANGLTIWDNVMSAECLNRDVIRANASPFKANAGIATLFGNIAPNGSVVKVSAASSHLLQHRGNALVFENVEEMNQRIDDESLDVDENSVLVLKNCGPRGYPGMAEVGNMPLPRKLLRRGITDMLRLTDARMSGTAYGTVVLHMAPEAAAGGPLAAVRTGDVISIDAAARKVNVELTDEELHRRLSEWREPPLPERGWLRLYVQHVQQADVGADFDFLVGGSGAPIPRQSH